MGEGSHKGSPYECNQIRIRIYALGLTQEPHDAPNAEGRFRQSLRLKNYDYTWAGAYFVTVVAQNRACLFGTIENDISTLSPAGEMLQTVWENLPIRFSGIKLDAFVVMPNHVHAIIAFPAPFPVASGSHAITAEQKVPTRGTPTERPALGTVVGAWKSLTTNAYIAGGKAHGWQPFAGRLWQRNFYEHVVRGDDDLARIRYYIETNPRNWAEDTENPHHRPTLD